MKPSACNFRSTAEPTRPAWPATKMRVSLGKDCHEWELPADVPIAEGSLATRRSFCASYATPARRTTLSNQRRRRHVRRLRLLLVGASVREATS